jgi:hypothetical protein
MTPTKIQKLFVNFLARLPLGQASIVIGVVVGFLAFRKSERA